jgi:hypothetical protein
MSRGLGIANGLQKKSTTAGVRRLDVVSLCNFPVVSGRKAYILNQGTVAGVTFLFRGRYSGQRLWNSRSYRRQTPLFSRVSRFETGDEEGRSVAKTVLY